MQCMRLKQEKAWKGSRRLGISINNGISLLTRYSYRHMAMLAMKGDRWQLVGKQLCIKGCRDSCRWAEWHG